LNFAYPSGDRTHGIFPLVGRAKPSRITNDMPFHRMLKEEFTREVEKELTKDEDQSELIYSRCTRAKFPSSSKRSRLQRGCRIGQVPRLLPRDDLCRSGGAHLDDDNPEILRHPISRYYRLMPNTQKEAFLAQLGSGVLRGKLQCQVQSYDPYFTKNYVAACLSETTGIVSSVEQ
jgi:hypothetical protein